MQCFAILHDFRETYYTENTFTLTFIHKSKRRSIMQKILRQETFVARHMLMVERQNYCVARQKTFINTIKQLLHRCRKIFIYIITPGGTQGGTPW